MPALTLLEASKLASGNEIQSAVIELYAGSSAVLNVLPFRDIQGNALTYNQEVSLPGVGFRGVNEGYVPSVGIVNPQTESLVIAGGEVDVDRVILRTMGEEVRSTHESMKIRSLGLAWTRKFIKGDHMSNPREFDGLQTRVVGNQLMSAGTTSGGAALSLATLDEAIANTLNPTAIIMDKKMGLKFSAAARNPSIGGYIVWGPNEFGKKIMFYGDLPILTLDLDNDQNSILPFTETAYTGADTATSIYVVSIGPAGLTGIQNGTMDVEDLGILETQPVFRTRIEWLNGIAIFNGRAVTRLRHIGNLPIVA